MPDITTIAACSTALGAIMCIAILLSWLKDGRPTHRSWLFAPFGIAVPAGVLLTYPEVLPSPYGLAIGWFLLTLTYGAVWQTARVAAGRRPRPILAIIACTIALIVSLTIGGDPAMPELRMLARTLLFALFNGLTAREFYRMRDPQLPSAKALQWIFATFFVFDFARSPLALVLPAPLGPEPTQVWSIATFNFLLVLLGLLLAVFMTALNREQLAAKHFHLANTDPLTGIGNRRALQKRLAHFAQEPAYGRVRAVALLDIDLFKTINDELGHSFGDIVIVGAAQVAQGVFGDNEVFRIGGEEFAVLIEATDESGIIARAEAMRERFAARAHVEAGKSRRCTISIGLALVNAERSYEDSFRAADRALYLAKRLGRNQTTLAGSDPATDRSVADEDIRVVTGQRENDRPKPYLAAG